MKIDETPEAVVLNSCLGLLSILGIFCWRNNTGALASKSGRLVRYGLQGSADIIGILPDGRFLSVECKRKNGKIRQSQLDFMAKIKENHGVACIVHDTDELMEVLKHEGVVK